MQVELLQLFAVFTVGLCAISVSFAVEIEITKTFEPEKCEFQTVNGNTVHMNYTGMFTDGTVFDRTHDQLYVFKLGVGSVIRGMDQGMLGMCVGEKRHIVIPSDLGYGDGGSPPVIPGGATLVFDVELKKIEGYIAISKTFEPEDCVIKSVNGNTLHMNYTGRFTNGTVFDRTYDQLYVFKLGVGSVIRGMDQGMLGMCEGEKRHIVFSSDLGYGDNGYSPIIPGGATLVFDVELKKIEGGVEISKTFKPENCVIKSVNGNTLHMNYTGRFTNGTVFDRTHDQLYVFKLGVGSVIQGMDQGMLGVCEGEKRHIVIPSYLGYGDRGYLPMIPGGATLVFDVELKKIEGYIKISKTFEPENCVIKSVNGNTLHMNYTGMFTNGTVFDRTHDQLYVFKLGVGSVIRGVDQGMLGMCVGEKRHIVFSSDLGYGDNGKLPIIPGGATLVFDVELKQIDTE